MSRLVHLYINKIEYSIAIYYYKQIIKERGLKRFFYTYTLKLYLVIHLYYNYYLNNYNYINYRTDIKHNWTLPSTICGACAPHNSRSNKSINLF